MWLHNLRVKLPLLLVFSGIIVLLFLQFVSATTVTWNCTTGTNTFDTLGCWTTGSVPVAGDDVVFNATGNSVVNITNNTLPQNLNSFLVEPSYNSTIHFNALFANGSWADSDTDYGAIGTQYWNVTNNINISGGTMKIYGDYVGNSTNSPGYNLTAEGEGQQWKSVNGNITIGSGAMLDGDGLGFPAAAGLGYAGGVAAHGGRAYATSVGYKNPYGNATAPTSLGSGSVSFAGASGVKLDADLIDVNGIISMNGSFGSGCCNYGSSGGSIWLKANTIQGAGQLLAKGGDSSGRTGGGGGRIRIGYENNMTFTGIISTKGGTSGGSNLDSSDGTLTFTNNLWLGDWNLTGNIGLLGGDSGDGEVTNVWGSFNTNGFNLTVYGDCVFNSTSPLLCYNSTSDGKGVWINASGNITISSGSKLYGKGLGFPPFVGPGKGGGGSYGGLSGGGGTLYGNATAPTSLGSGGGDSVSSGGSAIKLESKDSVIVYGILSFDGNGVYSSSSDGGSGGSIWLKAVNSIIVQGSLNSSGGIRNTETHASGGGGGRIALTDASLINIAGVVTNKGGHNDVNTQVDGSGGTVYINALNSINYSGNVSLTGKNGGYLNVTDSLLFLTGSYNATSINLSAGNNGKITLNFTNCGSIFTGTFEPSYTNNGADCESPLISIVYPTNTTYSNIVTQLNYTSSDDFSLDSCWYSLDSGATNTTITCGNNATGLGASSGSYTWKVYANDTFGNENSSSVIFTVSDAVNPSVTINFPTNRTYGNSSLPLNFDVNLNENGSVQYSLNGGVNNITMTGNQGLFGTSFNASNSSIADGSYTFSVYANDTSGNNNYTESVVFSFDSSLIECNDGIDNDGDGLIDWEYDLGCYGSEDLGEDALSREQENNWTTYGPAVDTNIIYVSNSVGNDSWDGLAPDWNGSSGPKKSVTNASSLIRNGYSDWLLFRRGDSWQDESLGNLFDGYSGASSTNPLIISSYGNSTIRPKFNFSASTWFSPSGNVENISIIGLHIYSYTRDPFNPQFTGGGSTALQWLGTGGNFLFEDNKVEYSGTSLQGSPTLNFTLRRNIFTKAYSISSHAQSLFTSMSAPLLIEQNIFNHGGWNDDFRMVLTAPSNDSTAWATVSDGRFGITLATAARTGTTYNISGVDFSTVTNMTDIADVLETAINNEAGAGVVNVTWTLGQVFMIQSDIYESDANYEIIGYNGSTLGTDINNSEWLNQSSQGVPESTIFNRNRYISHGYGNATVRGNIDANGASGGIQLRMGGILDNDLFLKDAISITFGHSQNDPFNTSGVIRNNVILGSRDIDTQPQGGGIILTSIANVTTSPYGPSYIKDLQVYDNIIAHNIVGSTGNINGLNAGGGGPFINADIYNNIFYNWTRPDWSSSTDHRAYGFSLSANETSTNSYFRNNIVQQPDSGFVGSSGNSAAGLNLTGNRYYSVEPDPPPIWSQGWFDIGGAVNTTYWISQTNETNVSLEQVNFVDPSRNIESYMASLGETATYDAFIEKALNQSRFNWNPNYTAYVVNDYIRDGFTIQGEGNDTTAPSVTLSAPANFANVTSATQSFNATFTDETQLANNTFYLWNSTGDNINTTTTTITGTSNSTNLSVTLPYEDTFTWNYLAYDNSSNWAFASSNYTITYNTTTSDTTNPAVIIHSPRNRTYNNNTAIDVRYRARDSNLDSVWYFVLNSSSDVIVANTTLTGNTTFTMPVTGANFTFFLYANDTSGNLNNSENVTFNVLNDRRYVRYEEFSGRGDTTNLDGLNDTQLANLSGFILHEPSHGKIKFLVNVDLTNTSGSNNVTNLDLWINITSNRIEINSSAVPGLNVSANLTLTNLTFTTPRILRDGVACESVCTQLSYSSGVLVFNVTGFSVYTTEEGAETESFSIESSPSGSGRDANYVPPFYENTYVKDANDLKFFGEIVQGLKVKERVRIKVNDKVHHVGVKEINNSAVIIGVESEEQTANLKVSGSAKFDLDNDKYYDLIVTLKSLIDNKAELSMGWIYEKVPAEPIMDKGEEEISDSVDENRGFWQIIVGLPAWIYLIVLGVVIGLIILIFVLWQLGKPNHARIVFRGRH